MSDGTSTGPQQDADRIVLSVAEVAHRLSVTPDAVRARLHRGTLPGEKVAGEWRVFLPRAAPPSPHVPTGTQQGPTGPQQATDRMVPVEALAAKDALIDALQADVEYLRDQLDRRSRELAAERERFDVLHREALERIPRRLALTSGETEQDGAELRQDAPGAAETPEPPPDASPSGFLGWWRRLWGGA